LTKQPDEEGSSRSLILSLLLDHCLLFHPEQLARFEDKSPACTVGSLQEKIKLESLFEFIKELLSSDNPEEKLNLLAETAKDVFKFASSKKHMVNRDWGHLGSARSLKYKARAA